MTTTTRQGSGNNVRKDFKELRAKEAQERKAAWDALGLAKQIEALSERPGKSANQHARLNALLNKAVAYTKKRIEGSSVAEAVKEAKVEPARPKAKDRRAAEQARTSATK